jgi:hypothetical protein
MHKLVEVVDDEGRPTMIPFHRVIRVVKVTSFTGVENCVVFCLDGGSSVALPPGPPAERAWAMYREYVSSLQ